MVGMMSPTHIALLLLAVLLIFGAKRLPELGRSLGSGMREFRHSISEHSETPLPVSEHSESSLPAEHSDTQR